MQHQSIARGDVVLRLQGSGPCDLKPDRCALFNQIVVYFELDGKSGTPSPLFGIQSLRYTVKFIFTLV